MAKKTVLANKFYKQKVRTDRKKNGRVVNIPVDNANQSADKPKSIRDWMGNQARYLIFYKNKRSIAFSQKTDERRPELWQKSGWISTKTNF